MMEDIHIPDGTAVKLLLAGLVLASGAVGALGVAHGTSQAAVTGAADGSSNQLAFPIDNVTAAFPIDNVTMAFPIDDVSVSGGSWDVTGTNRVGGIGTGSPGANTFSLARVEAPDELPQDMDPY
jgi:hypothetical protein